jgi:hypothetical protein
MKLDHLCNVCFTHSAGGIGTLDTLTPDGGMREVQYHCITLYWLSLASLEPAKLKTIPATKAARIPLRCNNSVRPSTVSERARLTVKREVRSMVSFLSAHLRLLLRNYLISSLRLSRSPVF